MDMIRKPTERFSDRVDDYVKYRPGYPPAVLDCLRVHCGLVATAVIADIGSGTGKLTQLLLGNGNRVYAVEPNDPMRLAAEILFAQNPHFISSKGTAEQTTLSDHSIDLITVGQAFHWFDAAKTRIEFQRILKPEAFVALIWNTRKVDGTPFMQAFENVLRSYSPDYKIVHHSHNDHKINELFTTGCQTCTLSNQQDFDFAGLKGRALSSSYAPAPDNPQHIPFVKALQTLFNEFEQNGRIYFDYATQVFYGRL